MALNTAMRWRLVTQNAATLIDPPRVTARGITPFTPEQSRTFLKGVGGHELESFFTVALACGLRLGESLGLRWADVDLEAATLQIRRAMQRFGGDASSRRPLLAERKRLLKLLCEAKAAKDHEGGRAIENALASVRVALRAVKTEVQFVEPKSARSRRTISLPATVVKSLTRHRVRQLESRLAAGKRWQDSGLVFSTSIGTPLDGRNVTRAFKGILESQELPAIRIHDLRHSCATLLLMQGVSPRVVMETLGHSQVSLTLNTYSHVLPALQEDAASKMDAILSRS
jgi:integrase